jgi:hypothetical protein
MDWGKPLANGGGHEVDDTTLPFSFLKATSRSIPSLRDLPISGETQSFGLGGAGALAPFHR